jgi:hypothetical protein
LCAPPDLHQQNFFFVFLFVELNTKTMEIYFSEEGKNKMTKCAMAMMKKKNARTSASSDFSSSSSSAKSASDRGRIPSSCLRKRHRQRRERHATTLRTGSCA